MHRTHRFILLVLGGVLFTVACDKAVKPEPVTPAEGAKCGDFDPASSKIPDAWLMCQTDADCVRAHQDCCDCDSGSNGVAVGKEFAACVTPACAEPVSCAESVACQDRVVCNEGMCGLAPAAPVAEEPEALDCAGYVAGSDEVPQALRGCASDEDCTLAQYTCCPCSSGGERVAVAVSHAGCIKRGPECGLEVVCPSVYLCDDYGVACQDGVCTRTELK